MESDSNSRNMIAFFAIALVILFGYQYFVMRPAELRRMADARARAAVAAQAAANPAAVRAGAAPVAMDRAQALRLSPRVAIDTPALQGSVALRGARIDDLYLKDYRQTLAKGSPPVELFRPEGTTLAYFADFGWSGPAANLPGATSAWRQTGGGVLAPGKPITLTYDNGAGLAFARTIAVDARYVFTVSDTVRNGSPAPVTLAPYASVQRQGQPQLTPGFVFEGAVGELAGTLHMDPFKEMKTKPAQETESTGGWLGLTDKYWLAAIAPDQNEAVRATYRMTPVGGINVYEANYVGPTRTLAPGGSTTETRRLFAGAKKVSVLQGYEQTLGLKNFTSSVDWGTLWFLTRPIFWVLSSFQSLVGNFGVALLLLTVCVKLVTFPLYNQSYGSMARMKKLQPKIEEIKKRHDKDAVKVQQETMALYKTEKVNPLAGCVPALIPIPVFLALIKVLSVSIEMRQAPFVGWIQDLSAPDPSSIWNLFGLLPFHPAAVPLSADCSAGRFIGAWALLYGATTWLSQAMNPQAMADPTQRQIAQYIPLLFTFFMAQVASGLLVYYTWSGFLSAIQQYYIMHKYKTQNPIDDFIAKVSGKPGARVTDETTFDDEAIETARILFARPCDFIMGAAAVEQLPPPDLPEITFAGRSNVGKSSLINALTSRHDLARASNEPGRTRQVNLFRLDDRARLVDLPGYGFARADRKTVRTFQNLGRAYLRGRPNLKRVYLLIDARHGLREPDAEALDALDAAAVSYQIVLTKTDKLRPASEGPRTAEATLRAIARRPAAFPRVALTSATTGAGLAELRAEAAFALG